MKKTILVIGTHADDNEISKGGTLLKYKSLGYDFVYVMTSNNMSGEFSWLGEDNKIHSRHVAPLEEMAIRKREAAAAAAVFGTEPIHMDFPQRHYWVEGVGNVDMDYGVPLPEGIPTDKPNILMAHRSQKAIRFLADLILKNDPEVIITNSPVDLNLEHISTALLVRSAKALAEQSGYDGTMLYGMSPAPFGIAPFYDRFDTFVDTTGFMQAKYDLVRLHASQKPVPERMDFRDFSVGARCGCETAEAFVVASFGQWKTGPLTVELEKNARYCRENYQKMFW